MVILAKKKHFIFYTKIVNYLHWHVCFGFGLACLFSRMTKLIPQKCSWLWKCSKLTTKSNLATKATIFELFKIDQKSNLTSRATIFQLFKLTKKVSWLQKPHSLADRIFEFKKWIKETCVEGCLAPITSSSSSSAEMQLSENAILLDSLQLWKMQWQRFLQKSLQQQQQQQQIGHNHAKQW